MNPAVIQADTSFAVRDSARIHFKSVVLLIAFLRHDQSKNRPWAGSRKFTLQPHALLDLMKMRTQT